MYPIIKYTQTPHLHKFELSTIKIFLKEYFKYILRYSLPNFVGNIVDLSIGNYIEKNTYLLGPLEIILEIGIVFFYL